MSRILLVDDYDQLSTVMEAFLRFASHEVVTAQNGVEALEMFSNNFFDLVITDLWMPEMDGVKLIAAVKESRPETRILAISGAKGGSTGPMLRSAVEAGADATLEKPFSRKDLFDQLDFLLGCVETKKAG